MSSTQFSESELPSDRGTQAYVGYVTVDFVTISFLSLNTLNGPAVSQLHTHTHQSSSFLSLLLLMEFGLKNSEAPKTTNLNILLAVHRVHLLI